MMILRRTWITLKLLTYIAWTSSLFLLRHAFKAAPTTAIDGFIERSCQALITTADIQLHCHGSPPPRKPGTPYMIMCNHRSLIDIPISSVVLRGHVRMIAKKELRYVPIFGRLMKKMQMVFLDRQRPKLAMKQLRACQDQLKDTPLWCSPEGTRASANTMLPFKKGVFMLAIQTGATIIPMVVDGAEKVLPNAAVLIQPNQKVTAHIGQPIDSKRYNIRTLKQLMHDTRSQMLDMMDNNT